MVRPIRRSAHATLEQRNSAGRDGFPIGRSAVTAVERRCRGPSYRGCVDELSVGNVEVIAEIFGVVDGDGIDEEAHVEPASV